MRIRLVDAVTGAATWLRGQGGAALVSDIGPEPNLSQDRYIANITDTWPGDDTFSVSFSEAENVRRYRWKYVENSGTVTHVKVAEDAADESQEEAFLADPSESRNTKVMHRRLVGNDTWSEWQELSKDSDDVPLARLGFLAAGTSPDVDIYVEAE